MDIASIEKLIALVEASGIGELEIAEGASSVRISRAISSPTAVGSSAVSAAVVQPQLDIPIQAAQARAIASDPATEHIMSSPMVGTFISLRDPVRRHLWLWVSRLILAIPCASSKR